MRLSKNFPLLSSSGHIEAWIDVTFPARRKAFPLLSSSGHIEAVQSTSVCSWLRPFPLLSSSGHIEASRPAFGRRRSRRFPLLSSGGTLKLDLGGSWRLEAISAGEQREATLKRNDRDRGGHLAPSFRC